MLWVRKELVQALLILWGLNRQGGLSPTVQVTDTLPSTSMSHYRTGQQSPALLSPLHTSLNTSASHFCSPAWPSTLQPHCCMDWVRQNAEIAMPLPTTSSLAHLPRGNPLQGFTGTLNNVVFQSNVFNKSFSSISLASPGLPAGPHPRL